MDESKKTKKGGAKKDNKLKEPVAPASSGELMFGAASNTDMINFGGDDEQFGEKERETNIIRKRKYNINNIDLYYQQRTTRKCLTII